MKVGAYLARQVRFVNYWLCWVVAWDCCLICCCLWFSGGLEVVLWLVGLFV